MSVLIVALNSEVGRHMQVQARNGIGLVRQVDATEQNCSIRRPLVSVIILSYNHARYVKDCLDSVVATNYPHLELIIINDASPQDDDRAIREWLTENPKVNARYLKHEVNHGLTRTLNEAIKLAAGDYLCLIAADDIMLPTGIADRVDYLMKHPQKLAVFADCHVVNEGGKVLFESGIEDYRPQAGMRKCDLMLDSLLPYAILYNWAVPGPVFMAHRDLFMEIGPYDEDLLIEDWDMYMRAALAGRLGFVDAFVANYRLVSSSTMHRNRQSNHLLPSMKLTIDKNLTRTRGLLHMRLYAVKAAIAYDESESGLEKRFLWVKHKFLLALTNRLYKVFRFCVHVMVKTHRRKIEFLAFISQRFKR